MIDFLNGIGSFISMVGDGVKNFVDFIIEIPEVIYDLIEILPNPIYSIVIAIVGFLVFVLLIKVVRLIVG